MAAAPQALAMPSILPAAASSTTAPPPVSQAEPLAPTAAVRTGPCGQDTMPGIAGGDWQHDQAGVLADGGQPALMAFRPGPASLPGDGLEPDPFADVRQTAAGQPAERPRAHRRAGGHVMQRPARQKRGSAAAGHDPLPASPPEAARQARGAAHDGEPGMNGSGLAAMSGDLAGWASGELPGQASRQLAPWTPTYRRPDDADPAGGGTRRDKVV
jgi:hypothetical protein